MSLRISVCSAVAGDAAAAAWVPAAQRRRLDPLARAATAAVEQLGVPRFAADTALVVSTSYGAVESTHRFALSMATYGDRGSSPTPFTASVHNSCAGALGEMLGLHGPCTTLSQGGTGTLAALRWALLVLGAGRAPAVLAVIGDRHNAWSRRIVSELAFCPWPIGDGVAALLIERGTGPGRELRWGAHPAPLHLDGGAFTANDEALLTAAAGTARRERAADRIGAWWPCCLAAALPTRWDQPGAIQLREAEGGQMLAAWLGERTP